MQMEENLCKLGDIIVIDEFKNEVGEKVKKHSFVVINDRGDYIEGLKYDLVCNMLCSFHSDDHKKKKLSYKANFEIAEGVITIKNGNSKSGYIKADQLYYFNKRDIKYVLIGQLSSHMLNRLYRLIIVLTEQNKVDMIVTNLNSNKRGGHYG